MRKNSVKIAIFYFFNKYFYIFVFLLFPYLFNYLLN